MIRILLVDDHKIVREGISHILDKEQDMCVIAQADCGQGAVQLALEHRPDILLMDMSMPDMSGAEAARRILEVNPDCRIIMLSMHSDKRFVSQALGAGAVGYLLKGCASSELIGAIRGVFNNVSYLCEEFAGADQEESARAGNELTSREREVLQLIADGKNTKEIAFMLAIGAKTVETHRQRLTKKLNIFNVAELTKYAVREGITGIEG